MVAGRRTFERRSTTPWCASSRRTASKTDPAQAALRHHGSARGPRAGHRRVQAGLAGRRRPQGRPPGLFRDLLPRPGARPDACRTSARAEARVRPHRGASGIRDSPKPVRRRQLPGRLGVDAAWPRRSPDIDGSGGDQRRAHVLLGRATMARTRCATPAGMLGGAWLALLASDLGDGQVRRRPPRRQFRVPQPGEHLLSTSTTTCSPRSTPSRSASSSSSAGGAATS